jgi:hypothetical protein
MVYVVKTQPLNSKLPNPWRERSIASGTVKVALVGEQKDSPGGEATRPLNGRMPAP